MGIKGHAHKAPYGKRKVKSVLLASIVMCAIGYTWFFKPELTLQPVLTPVPSASATSTDTTLSSDKSSLQASGSSSTCS